MTKLIDLLTEHEIELATKSFLIEDTILSTDFKHTTVKTLSSLALILLQTENEKAPNCILGAKAIEILTKRAQERNLDLF